MEEKKTPEEILNSFDIIVYKDSPDTSEVAFSNEDTKSAMREYASQQSRSTAIGFGIWLTKVAILDHEGPDRWYEPSADDTSTTERMYDLYLQSLNIK